MRHILSAVVTFWIAIVDLEASGKWITVEDCQLISNPSNDGDSFHVRAKGRHYLFRLYFVDAPETDAEFRERVEEQSKYFGVTVEQIVKVGKAAKLFVGEKLATPFTVRTCKQDALGRSRLERFYALVQTKEGDRGEQLIENGLARIHGASANPVGLPRANVEWQKLQGLERAAMLEKVGGWGVNSGRMLARSASSKNRVPVDPFEAFFHPERAQGDQAVPALNGSPWPFPSPTPIARSTIKITVNATASSQSQNAKLDINSATQEQLEVLPGIGETLAGRIIAARPFKSADDLRNVKGIGDARYGKIRPYFN